MSNPHLLEVAESLKIILGEFVKDSKQLDNSEALCFPQTLPDGHCIRLFNTVSPKTPGIGYLLAEYSPNLSDCVFKIIIFNYNDLSKISDHCCRRSSSVNGDSQTIEKYNWRYNS